MRLKLLNIVLLFAVLVLPPISAKAQELNEGITAFENGAWDLAAEILEPYAVGGDFNAQFYMGELYLHGNGKEQDFEQAFRWYFEAAKSGHARAQANTGSLLSLGLGVPRDMPSASYWWILSAIWTDTQLTGSGFAALGEVAPLLSQEERKRIETSGKAAWGKSAKE